MGKAPLLVVLKIRFPELNDRELFSSVLRGRVSVEGRVCLKPREPISEDAEISIASAPRFVSRGGLKLSHALDAWAYEVKGKRFIDAGASTGGFTDCLLKRGAEGVYAVDVGYNQLDYALRRDPRVTVMERRNIMALTEADFPQKPDEAVADLSFRSLRRAALHILGLTARGAGIFLAKPQFEDRHPDADFQGVVKDDSRLRGILLELFSDLDGEGVYVRRALMSPVRGHKGNREFLLLLGRERPPEYPAGELSEGLFRE